MAKHNKSNASLLKIILLLLAALAISVGVILQRPVFKVTEVEVRLENGSCIEANLVRNKIDFEGKNIFTLSTSTLSILPEYPCIKEILVEKVFPHKIVLTVTERRPAVTLQSQEILDLKSIDDLLQIATTAATISGEFLAVDEKGVIFKKSDSSSWPRITFLNQKFTLGQNLPESLISAILKLEPKLKDFQIPVNNLWVFARTLVLQSSVTMIFNLDKNMDYQLTALQLILQKAKIDNKDLKIVDLRFENPVIKYGSEKNNGFLKK